MLAGEARDELEPCRSALAVPYTVPLLFTPVLIACFFGLYVLLLSLSLSEPFCYRYLLCTYPFYRSGLVAAHNIPVVNQQRG